MPKTPDYFHGKTIVITGAASGIGRATALIFAREGANVVCADLNEAGVKETASQVNAKGSQALALKVDVTQRKQVEDLQKKHAKDKELSTALAGIGQKLYDTELHFLTRTEMHSDDKWYVEKYALYMNLVWLLAELGGSGEAGELPGS